MKFEFAIALTGGIGSGKSTTSSLLRLYGYSVLCADSIAHNVLESNAKLVYDEFGSGILDSAFLESGADFGRDCIKIDRKKLGAIVFSNQECKKRLESILHPIIKCQIETLAKPLDSKKVPYFIDIPLFFETNAYDIKESLLVYAKRDICISRIIARNNFTKEEAISRVDSQMSLDSKLDLASYVIYNNTSLESLQKEVEKYLNRL